MVFDRSSYDVLPIQMPARGMNQNISPEALDLSFAYFLENIIPQPLGEGQVRYGTSKLINLNPYNKIIGSFPFVASDGKQQQLLYVSELMNDGTADNFEISEYNPSEFSFTTQNPEKYKKDLRIRIEYTYHGNLEFVDYIKSIEIVNQTVTITLYKNMFPPLNPLLPEDSPVISRISYASGSIYLYNVNTNIVSVNPLKTGLETVCIPRYEDFSDKIFICNGVDLIMQWDGENLTNTFQFLKENATQITRIDATNLSFKTGALFNIDNYAAGNKIRLDNNRNPTQLTITQRNLALDILTLTVAEQIPNLVNPTEIFYQAFPPRFSFLFSMHNRLWALDEGAAGLDFRSPDEAMRVYFMYKKGSSLEFFDEQTKKVPSINLSETHGVGDNLEAISYVNGLMLFIGRNATQAWLGSEPIGSLIDQNKPILQHQTTLPEGTIHGDLVLPIGNDVFMITKKGLISFGTLNIAKQFSVNSYDAVDPLIKQYMASITQSNLAYLETRSFKYDGGALAGFKIGFNNVLCSLFSTNFYAWTLFSGDFKEATAFCSLGNALYLLIDNIIYKYGDGNDGSLPSFGDEGDKAPVFFSWSLPVLKFDKRAYAGLFYDLHLSYPSSFSIREGNEINLIISGDLPKSYHISSPYRFELRGDSFATVPFVQKNFNEVTEKDIGLRFDQQYQVIQEKFKFLASRFWVTIKGQTQDGILSLKGIDFYGTIERKK